MAKKLVLILNNVRENALKRVKMFYKNHKKKSLNPKYSKNTRSVAEKPLAPRKQRRFWPDGWQPIVHLAFSPVDPLTFVK